MNHRQRTFAALLVLLGGFSAADAQLQTPPSGYPAAYGNPGYGVGGPGYGAGAPQGPLGAPMGMPSAGGWAGEPAGAYGLGGPAPQEALYNYYTNGSQAPMPPGRLPPDPFGPQRLHMPLPERNDDFAGGNEKNIHTRPDERSIGPRLDSSYTFFREAEFGLYGSEYQYVGAAALSFLPVQTPCWVVGTRLGVTYNNNTSVDDADIGMTSDIFWGTRFGHTYFKIGYFFDGYHDFRKHGVEGSILTKLGPLGNMTFDGAFGYGIGKDVFPTQNGLGIFQRAEVEDFDAQIRIGKFLSPYLQVGLSGDWTSFRVADNEFSGGLFANWYVGRATLSADLTGGTGGLRGYLVLGINWGGAANIDSHPIDPYFDNPIDTISWVTRATRRDITLKVRETDSGSGPPQQLPIILD